MLSIRDYEKMNFGMKGESLIGFSATHLLFLIGFGLTFFVIKIVLRKKWLQHTVGSRVATEGAPEKIGPSYGSPLWIFKGSGHTKDNPNLFKYACQIQCRYLLICLLNSSVLS